MLSELTDATNEGKGFSVYGIAYGLGSISEYIIDYHLSLTLTVLFVSWTHAWWFAVKSSD
jgi:hypothetical protein